jgi:hypothetical protein
MDFMHLHIINWIKDSMIILCDNIDTREDFLRGFSKSDFSMYFELRFFSIKSPFFNVINNIEAHISNLSSP